MLWLCFSEKGCSKSYFLNKGISMNQYNYLKECIQKRVMTFIRQYHADNNYIFIRQYHADNNYIFIRQYHTDNNYIFWPDQAEAHYAKSVINYLNEKNVNFVHKNDNPVNVPECRPIENFWAILKQQVYKNNWQIKNGKQIYQRIQHCLNKLDINLVQRVFFHHSSQNLML